MVEPVTLIREPSYLQVMVRPFLSPESNLYCLSTGRLKKERRKKEMNHVPPVKEGLGVRRVLKKKKKKVHQREILPETDIRKHAPNKVILFLNVIQLLKIYI